MSFEIRGSGENNGQSAPIGEGQVRQPSKIGGFFKTAVSYMAKKLPKHQSNEKLSHTEESPKSGSVELSQPGEIENSTTPTSRLSKTRAMKVLGTGAKGLLGVALILAGTAGMAATKGPQLLIRAIAFLFKLPLGIPLGAIGGGLAALCTSIPGAEKYLQENNFTRLDMMKYFGETGFKIGSLPGRAINGIAGLILCGPNFIARKMYTTGAEIFPIREKDEGDDINKEDNFLRKMGKFEEKLTVNPPWKKDPTKLTDDLR